MPRVSVLHPQTSLGDRHSDVVVVVVAAAVGGGCLLLSRSSVLWLSHLPCRSLSLSAARLDCNRCDKNTQQQSPSVNNGHTTHDGCPY